MTAEVRKDSEEADVEEEVVECLVADSLAEDSREAACQADSVAAVVGPFNGNPPDALSC